MDLEDALEEDSDIIKGDVCQFLISLPKPSLDSLYKSPSTCFGILRLLPDFSKHLIYRLLYVSEPISIKIVERMVELNYKKTLEENIVLLQSLSIILVFNLSNISLNQNFAFNLHNALVGAGDHSGFGKVCDSIDKTVTTVEFLDTYAIQSWESVLHYLVGTATTARPLVRSK